MIPRKLLMAMLIVLAAAVGFSHAYVKDLPDQSQIDSQMATMMAEDMWEGRPAPNFSRFTVNGESFELSDHVGDKVIILNFWATWCAPCREEIPELQRYFEENREEDVLVVGVNVGEDRRTVRAFMREIEMTFPVVLDESREVAEQYEVDSYPTTVVLGAQGTVKLYKIGMIRNADAAFEDVVTTEKYRVRSDELSISKQEYLERQEPSDD